MRVASRWTVCAAICLAVAHASRTTEFGRPGQLPNNLTWIPGRGQQLWLGGDEHQTIRPLQSIGICSSNVALHCLKYHVNSSTLVEAFLVDKIQYEDVQEGEEMQYEYVAGSHCLASRCDRRVRLHFKDWCLVVINTDPLFRTAEVNYSYQACLSRNDKHHAILVLVISLVFLVAAVCMCCVCCYRHGGRRQPYTIHPSAYTSITSEIHHPPTNAPLITYSKDTNR